MIRVYVSKQLRGAQSGAEYVSVPLDMKCIDVVDKISTEYKVDGAQFDLRHNSIIVPREQTLSSFNDGAIKDTHALIATPRRSPPTAPPAMQVDAIVQRFRHWFTSQHRARTLYALMEDRNTMLEIIDSTPSSLRADATAQRILTDFGVLRDLLFSRNFPQLQKQHPGIVYGIEAIMKRLERKPPQIHVSDEEMETDEDTEEQRQRQRAQQRQQRYMQHMLRQQGQRQQVTQQQLSAALAGALGQLSQSPNLPATPAPTPNVATGSPTATATTTLAERSGSRQVGVTAEMLQSAIMSSLAQAGGTSTSSAPPVAGGDVPPTAAELEQVEQLIAMGFGNRDENLRLLRACGHNLEATVDMLIAQRQAFDVD